MKHLRKQIASYLLTLILLMAGIFAFVKSKAKFMYSYNDFERLFLRYKLEGIPAGVST